MANSPATTPQVDQQIDHDLPWAVVGDLSAAVDMHHWHIANVVNMFASARASEGKYGWVLDTPNLITGGFVTLFSEGLHCMPARLVFLTAELTYVEGWYEVVWHETALLQRHGDMFAALEVSIDRFNLRLTGGGKGDGDGTVVAFAAGA